MPDGSTLDLVQTGGGLASILVVVVVAAQYFARKAVDDVFAKGLAEHKNELDADLESHKAQLQERVQQEIERLRSELARAQTRLTEYDRRQAEVLANLYPRLWDLRRDVGDLLDFVLSQKLSQQERLDHLKRAEAEALAFVKDVHRGAVYLPGELENELATVGGRIRGQVDRLLAIEHAGGQDIETLIGANEIDSACRLLKDALRELLSTSAREPANPVA